MNALLQERLKYDLQALEEFCQRWGIAELAVFGSVLTDKFTPESDINVLVEFLPSARPTLLDLAQMQFELSELFGRPVDLVERSAIVRSRNPIRRQMILQSAEILYASRVSNTIRESYPNIPWGQIIGMRNRLVHGYFEVDLSRVWDTVQQDVPVLVESLKKLLGEIGDE